jgi:Lrp/AsnC family transcriptional regulator
MLGYFLIIAAIMLTIDHLDHAILIALQKDCAQSLEDLGQLIGLSRNACWRRIRAMEDAGIIRKRVALVDPAKLGIGLQVFIQVRTSTHSAQWSKDFSAAVRAIPEIQGAYRMSGDLDYLIRARVRDVSDYDALYQRLTERVALSDVSASFVMEELKDSTELVV